MPLVILTDRELEFLASLRSSWSRLYWTEFARLMQEDDDNEDGSCVTPQPKRPQSLRPKLRLVN